MLPFQVRWVFGKSQEWDGIGINSVHSLPKRFTWQYCPKQDFSPILLRGLLTISCSKSSAGGLERWLAFVSFNLEDMIQQKKSHKV